MPPLTYYSNLEASLSPARIQTYKTFFGNHSDPELYGVYLWNKVLSGAFYPVCQAVEITVRNAVNAAAVFAMGDYWYEKLNHHPIKANTKSKNHYYYAKLCFNFRKAEEYIANRNRKKNGRPRFDSVVANTDFSTWEYVLHPCFYKVSGAGFLWPKFSKMAFKKWPDQSSKKTLAYLYDRVKEIRLYRNRLAHHEPLWKGVNVRDEASALRFVNKKINVAEEILAVLSPTKLDFLHAANIFSRVRSIANPAMLDVFRNRRTAVNVPSSDVAQAALLLSEFHAENELKLVSFFGNKFILEPSL